MENIMGSDIPGTINHILLTGDILVEGRRTIASRCPVTVWLIVEFVMRICNPICMH